jgi:serine O-acetyltransferase
VPDYRQLDSDFQRRLDHYAAMSLREVVSADARLFGSWKRALSTTGFWAVLSHRVASRLSRLGLDIPACMIQLAAQIIFGCEISRRASIGPSFAMLHPVGVYIGRYCRIGKGCTVNTGTFLGSNLLPDDPCDSPTIDDGVGFGPGARVMGPVIVGAGCRVGPNAVVLRSLPANTAVVTAPSRMVLRPQFAAPGSFAGQRDEQPAATALLTSEH